MKALAGSGRKSMSILATIEYLSNKAASVEGLAIPRTTCRIIANTMVFVTAAGTYTFSPNHSSLLGRSEGWFCPA